MATAYNTPATRPATYQPLPAGHEERVRAELHAAGLNRYGMAKFAVKYLPNVIHGHEHIRAAVYGRQSGTMWSWFADEGLLVATDTRIIFLDHKPGYHNMEEVTYEVVAGIQQMSAGLFSGITLHTRTGDFTLHYVNARCAQNFAHYVENRCMESKEKLAHVPAQPSLQLPPIPRTAVWNQAQNFLNAHDTAVLSTIDRQGETHGATVHYLTSATGDLLILTKADTGKVHNIFAHPQVAVTVYDADQLQTVQMEAIARIEPDRRVKDWVWHTMVRPHEYGKTRHLPPVTDLHDGAFTILRLTPMRVHFADFS